MQARTRVGKRAWGSRTHAGQHTDHHQLAAGPHSDLHFSTRDMHASSSVVPVSTRHLDACRRRCTPAKARSAPALTCGSQHEEDVGVHAAPISIMRQTQASTPACTSARASCWRTLRGAGQHEAVARMHSRVPASRHDIAVSIAVQPMRRQWIRFAISSHSPASNRCSNVVHAC